jgi:hypothetical protein
MRHYHFQLTLCDLAFVLVSFMLLGAGCVIMWLNGFDAWLAYLVALPIFFAVGTICSALLRASRVDHSDSKPDLSGASQPPPRPK